MTDLLISGILLNGLELVFDDWEEDAIYTVLWENDVSRFMVDRFVEYLHENREPESCICYVYEPSPKLLERLDSANLLAKMLRFIESLESPKCDDQVHLGLLRNDLEQLASATFALIGSYHIALEKERQWLGDPDGAEARRLSVSQYLREKHR